MYHRPPSISLSTSTSNSPLPRFRSPGPPSSDPFLHNLPPSSLLHSPRCTSLITATKTFFSHLTSLPESQIHIFIGQPKRSPASNRILIKTLVYTVPPSSPWGGGDRGGQMGEISGILCDLVTVIEEGASEGDGESGRPGVGMEEKEKRAQSLAEEALRNLYDRARELVVERLNGLARRGVEARFVWDEGKGGLRDRFLD